MDEDDNPPPSRYGLLMAALIMATGFVFILSWTRGWRPW